MQYDKNGFNAMDGLYKSRYFAQKAMIGDKKVVKVCGGYKIMDFAEYNVWRNQK